MYHDVLAAIDVSQVNSLRETGDSLPQPAMQAIYRLMNACEYARHAGRSTWEFAVKITELLREGISENELRLLVCRGYVEHAKEVTTRSCSERAFNKDVSLRFSKRTAFILSETGIAFCRESLEAQWRSDECGEISVRCGESAPALCNGKHGDETITNAHNDVVPKWDHHRRELRVGDRLVKVFKLPSPMQERIVMAFEEEGWPPRIDDPLPMSPDLLPKRRLHDTIKSLNRNQKSCVIRFMGDGTGEGIRWEFVGAS